MVERQPRRPAHGVPPYVDVPTPEPDARGADADAVAAPRQDARDADAGPRAYRRRIDCSPDAPRPAGWGGRHR